MLKNYENYVTMWLVFLPHRNIALHSSWILEKKKSNL
ncbi:MAG: hypothetical protein RL607_2004 [Bacteroidota bacterium]|jgi:hypothetical protein